jgi:DNA-binding HxlR family transcriptional regulator
MLHSCQLAVSNLETVTYDSVSENKTSIGVVMASKRRAVPGQPVRGSTTGRPLMAAMDLLGKRWTLRILWELRDGPLGARELQSKCDAMSSSVLYERIRELSDAGLVVQDGNDAYELTKLGRSLNNALGPLDSWAKQWAKVAHREV